MIPDSAAASRRQEILARLDIEAEYRALGLRIVGRNSAGWLTCHAAGREDSSPSAVVNDRDQRFERGRYRDRGSGESLSLFDFCAKYGGLPGVHDYRTALAHFARRAGVDLADGGKR